jgi:hypothetical protein
MALPALSLGLESDRAAWRTREHPPSSLWSPAGFTDAYRDDLEITDPELAEIAAEVVPSCDCQSTTQR